MNPIDRDFARFVRAGEPAALGRVYDGAASELLALATRLVGSPVEAEDLVQATFVVAIESANSFVQGSRVMPWLVGILNNRVRQFRQSRERVAAKGQQQERLLASMPAVTHEELFDPATSDPTPTQQLEGKELDQAVALAIGALSPLLHPVVVLHLRHGMQPAEIAYALARPPATVRSQLARGLADLRRRLPRQHLLPALLLLPVPRGLGAIRSVVMQHGAMYKAALTAAAATTLGTVMIMTKKIQVVLAAVVVLAIGAGAYWLPNSASLPAPDEARQPVIEVATSASEVAWAASAAPAQPDSPSQRVALVKDHRASIRVTVRTQSQPLEGAVVELIPTYVIGDLGRTLCVATNADGIAHFVDVPWSYGHAVVQGARVTGEWASKPGETAEVELVLPEPGWIRGQVLNATGGPVADAVVWLVEPPYGVHRALDVLRTESDGMFALPVWNWHLIGARAPGTVGVHREVKVGRGESVAIVLQLGAGGATLRGKVVRGDAARDEDVRPVAGAEIEVGDRFGSYEGRLLPDGSRETVVSQVTVTDDAGEFVVDGLLPGVTSVYAVAKGSAPLRQEVELRAQQLTETTLMLEEGVRVSGRATLPDGEPARSATVLSGHGFTLRRVRVDRDGRFELANVPVGMTRLIASRLGRTSARQSQLLVAGEDFEWNPVLNARWSQIEGKVQDAQGQALANWYVVAHTDSIYDAGMTQRTEPDGTFRFEQLLATPEVYALHVHPPCELDNGAIPSPQLPAVLVQRSVAVGAEGVQLVVPAASLPTAWVNGRVADSVSDKTVLWLVSEDNSRRYIRRERDGSFSCGPLAPGTWRIVQQLSGSEFEVCIFVLHAREARELGTVEVAAIEFGTVDIVLSGNRLNPEFAAEFAGVAAAQVLMPDERVPGGLQFVCWLALKGEHTELSLAPGRYVIRLCGAPLSALPEACEVHGGKACSVAFDAQPAAIQRIAFRHPQSSHPFEPLDLTVHDQTGALIWSMRLPPQQDWWHTELNLPKGAYRLVASTASGLHGERLLRIDGLRMAGRPLVIALQ